MTINNKKIVLDSCILIYACDEETKEGCLKLLEELILNNRIACSSLSGFEVTRNRQHKENEKDYTDLLNKTYRIPIDTPVLCNASTLYYLYEESGRIKKKSDLNQDNFDPKDKLTGDLIIGGTVISYENHLLLTANKKDFPEPYWVSVCDYEIIKNDASKIKIYLLEPIMNEILKKLDKGLAIPENWPSKENLYSYRG